MGLFSNRLISYFVAISAISFLITVYDKYASRHKKLIRIPENLLFGVAAIGGSVVMYVMMLLIRHKTKHKNFMIGIPLIIVVQGLILLAYYFIK